MVECINQRPDSGLECAALLVRSRGMAWESESICHRLGGGSLRPAEKLNARVVATIWKPPEAIVGLSVGGFLARVHLVDDKVLTHNPPEECPRLLTRAEFEAASTGQLARMACLALLGDLGRSSNVGRFFQAGHKCRQLLGKFWAVSLFSRIFKLLPLLFWGRCVTCKGERLSVMPNRIAS